MIYKLVLLPIRLIGLVFEIPWRWYYFSYRWRYRVTTEQTELFIGKVNAMTRHLGGPGDFIKVRGIMNIGFWWFLLNSILKRVYKFLKHDHRIAEEDSNTAKDVFVKIVPLLFSNIEEISGGSAELRYVNSCKFMARSTDYFMRCRGNVFTPAYVDFIQIMITVREDAVRAMKVAYAYAVDHIVKRIVITSKSKQLVDNVLEFGLHVIDLSANAPEALCEGLAAYADNLAQTAILYKDAQAANHATLASQSMVMLRTTVSRRRFSDNDEKELESYFANMRLAGAAIYNHLQKPIALPPPPPPPLPPTQAEAADMVQFAELKEKLAALEKENAKSREALPAIKERMEKVVQDLSRESGVGKSEPKYDDGMIALHHKKPDLSGRGKKISELNYPQAQGREGYRFRVWQNEYDFRGDKMVLTARKQVEYMDHLLKTFKSNSDPKKPIKPLESNAKSIFKKKEHAAWFSRHVRPHRDGRGKWTGLVDFSLDILPPDLV